MERKKMTTQEGERERGVGKERETGVEKCD